MQLLKGKAKAPAFQRHLHSTAWYHPQERTPDAGLWHRRCMYHTWYESTQIRKYAASTMALPEAVYQGKHGTWNTHGLMAIESWRMLKGYELWLMIKSSNRQSESVAEHEIGVSVSRCLGPWQLSFLHSPECGDCSSRREGIEKIKKRATDLCFFADTLHTLQQKLHILTLSYLCPVMPCHAVWSESGPPPFHCYIRVTGLQMNACVCVRYSHRNRYKMIQWIQLLSLSGSVSSPTCLHGQLSVRKQK